MYSQSADKEMKTEDNMFKLAVVASVGTKREKKIALKTLKAKLKKVSK